MNSDDGSEIIELRRLLSERFPHARTWSNAAPAKTHSFWATGLPRLDSLLQGGLSLGAITEIAGNGSGTGGALLLRALLRQTAHTGRLMGLIDGSDSFDPCGLEGAVLSRLFWVRCKTADEALKATDILLRDRNLSLIALDLKMNPAAQLRKISGATWYRLQRIARQSATTFVALTPHPMIASAETRLILESRFTLDALPEDEARLLSELKFELVRSAAAEESGRPPANFMFAVIHIPDFELQAALRLEPELRSRPVALMDDAPVKATVLQLTAAARQAGVCRGQTSPQAMARCSELVIKTRSRAREETVTAMLLQCAYGFSPAIEATAAGVCTLDLKGIPAAGDPERAHFDTATKRGTPLPNPLPTSWGEGIGGPGTVAVSRCTDLENWGENILDALERLQLHGQIGVAETPHLARLAAKQARPFLFAREPGPFVASLPIEALEPSENILDILEKWGVQTVGAFLALGKENLSERLGPEAVELFDLASSPRIRPLNRVVPAETFEEAMDFEKPVESLEPLLFILRRFIEQLARRLEMLYLVAADLHLRLGLASGQTYERLFVIPAPTRDVETLFRALQTHLENVRTDSPISSLRLGAKPGRAANYQFGLFNAALRDPTQFHQTLARLTALVGAERVGTPRLKETHRPDDVRMDLEGITTPRDQEPGAAHNPEPSMGLALRRFRPPLPASVEMREAQPAALRSAAFTGPIAAVRGPWRLSGHWWDNTTWARDEWDVQTRHGELLRLTRQEEHWLVDGIFD